MPPDDHNSDRPNTLPRPELDPTVNPVLGQNMGRWAEVYFTTAPEKREEAVLELLRTLEAENGAREAGTQEIRTQEARTQEEGVAAAPLAVQHEPAPRLPESQGAEGSSRFIGCHSCGRENRAHQRFCGMCGARLEKDSAPDPQIAQIEEPPQIVSTPQAQSWERLRPLEPPAEEAAVTSGEFLRARDGGARESNNDYLTRFSDVSQGSSTSLYYVGVALAIVILAISYIAWRGAHTSSWSSPLTSQAPTADSSPSPASVQIPVAPAAASSSSSPTAAAEPANQKSGTNLRPEKARPTPEATPQAIDEKNPAATFSGSGSEELATARRYLVGTDGQQQNPAEAVNWLWKAVAKRNTEATLLLSDLFLKGNGVPKSCDQGRVLLDAAATRGSKDAGERLRHLQAFGCQ